MISSFFYLEDKLDIIPVNKGVGTFLKVFVLAASLCCAFLSPRTHKYPICNTKNTTVQTISLISFCAILSQFFVSATMQNSIKKNRILACSINFLSQRNTDLLLPKHSSSLQGKPSLSVLLEKAGSENFLCSAETCLHQSRVYTALVCTALFQGSYPAKSQDTAISDKGKTCLETDSPTPCLILVFWYFRYRNSFHLLTALCDCCFITSSPYQSPFSKMPTLNFHSNKLKRP